MPWRRTLRLCLAGELPQDGFNSDIVGTMKTKGEPLLCSRRQRSGFSARHMGPHHDWLRAPAPTPYVRAARSGLSSPPTKPCRPVPVLTNCGFSNFAQTFPHLCDLSFPICSFPPGSGLKLSPDPTQLGPPSPSGPTRKSLPPPLTRHPVSCGFPLRRCPRQWSHACAAVGVASGPSARSRCGAPCPGLSRGRSWG